MKKVGLSDALTAFLINKLYREKRVLDEESGDENSTEEFNPFELDQNYLLFECSQQYFAFECKFIQDILEPDQICSLPLISDDIQGFCQVNNENVPIIDFHKIFNLTPPQNLTNSQKTEQKTVILNQSNKHYGIIVDKIIDIVKFPANTLSLDFPFDIPLKNVQAFKEYLSHLVCILEISMLAKEFPFSAKNIEFVAASEVINPPYIEEIGNISGRLNNSIR